MVKVFLFRYVQISVAGFLKMKDSFKGKKVVLTICGRNIDLNLFKQIIA